MSHFNYEICELRRRPGKLSERLPMGRRSGSRCIEFIIRPNFLTSNSRYLNLKFDPKNSFSLFKIQNKEIRF
ncbi:hypothetical protein [Leptospira noguchii]|uniref:hypothetical protein n=1 Tax=Leptospira noguchii TaxID=28182 RepID=UPI001FB837E7|nr:hypothetical protein [Leptospira noguchii]UOG55099.1 hypothetical protein MAL09_22195 [Leptospira noguchii]